LGEEGSVGESRRSAAFTRARAALVASLGIIGLIAAVGTATPAAASSNIAVFVGYADSVRADATNFPTPWAGSPRSTFEGCLPVATCEYDGGAIRVVNNSGNTVHVSAIALHLDTCTYTGWPGAVLAPGTDLIVTQLKSGAAAGCTGPTPDGLDTSDIGPNGSSYARNCVPNGIVPTVDITVDNVTTTYADSGQVLNTGGVDAGWCTGNESTQWTTIGHAPCRGSLFTLAPPAQTHPVLGTATVTATFTNSCGQALSNTAVNFSTLSGPNAGGSGSGITDANGQASFSYSSGKVGTDSLRASISNLAGSINSNTVTATWTLSFAPGGGAFVISDLKDINGHAVYWWGAQWWKNDQFRSGAFAPASFKGFVDSTSSPWCGQTWTTRPGNSSRPPKAVAPNTLMAVIVSSHITKRGPVISGDIVHIVLVRTNPGYGPNPGHPGTGTIVVANLC
jgi:hypothetical protein